MTRNKLNNASTKLARLHSGGEKKMENYLYDSIGREVN